MALVHVRRMWNHCRHYNLFFMHSKTFCTGQASLVKKDILSLFTKMNKRQQYNIACLGRSLCDHLQTNSGNSFSFVVQKNFSSCCVYYNNKLAKDLVSSLIGDIDMEELQKQVEKERKDTNGNVHLIHKVKEEVSKRCDEMLANLNPELERKLKVIKLEHSFFLSEGYEIPNEEQMNSENWLEALKLESKGQRLKYYRFVIKRIFLKEAFKLKRAAPKEEQEIERVAPYEHGRLFMRIYETTMKRWLNYRLASSMMFGIPLVIDMDYDSVMRPQEIKNTAAQLHDIYTINRADYELPFHLHFTNCPQDNSILRLFHLQLQEDQAFMASVSEKSYLDLFNKESLVYLSPNGRQVMREFDPNAVYIIGAFNDKATNQPLSYAKAKEQGIKCQRLPLDEYLKWGLGSKSLTLDQMIRIMLSLKKKKSWPEVFKVIPTRKLQNNRNSSGYN